MHDSFKPTKSPSRYSDTKEFNSRSWSKKLIGKCITVQFVSNDLYALH